MGIFDSLKNRVLGKREELGDIRSHVLGEDTFERGPYPERPPIEERDLGSAEVPELPEAVPGRGPLEPRSYGEPRFGGEPFGREPTIEREPPRSGDYEIKDRLNIIEAQLTAIRSQTETINERLKNLEMRLGGRY